MGRERVEVLVLEVDAEGGVDEEVEEVEELERVVRLGFMRRNVTSGGSGAGSVSRGFLPWEKGRVGVGIWREYCERNYIHTYRIVCRKSKFQSVNLILVEWIGIQDADI